MNLKRLCCILLFLLFGCMNTSLSSEEDAKEILNMLLNIDNPKYQSKDEKGQVSYNSLMAYKDWEKIYIKYSKYDQKNKKLTENEIKILLFIGFIAKTNLDAATLQSFASDLVPIFNENKSEMLKVLAELNFLIPSTCYHLNNYFGFEDKNLEKKIPFMGENTKIILKALGRENGEKCLAEFTSI